MDWKTLLGFTVIFHGIVYALRRQWILRIDTKKFNNTINGFSQYRIRKYLRIWFRIGTYVCIIVGFPFTIWLFLRTILITIFPSIISTAVIETTSTYVPDGVPDDNALELHRPHSPFPDAEILTKDTSSSPSSSSSYLAIQPILPGWNLPFSHLPYYIIAILVSVVIHELGHAIASASHRIPILSMGVSLFGPLIPAAHVELNSAQLSEAPIRKQLDILTAGVWMNMYLALITFFIVPKFLPLMFWPTHALGSGIAVTDVDANSGAGGPSGLQFGDIIIGIENCPAYDLDSWLTCLEEVWKSDPVGYCLHWEEADRFSNNSIRCCDPDKDISPTHLCFLHMNSMSKYVPSDSVSKPSNTHSIKSNYSSYCLPAKPIMSPDISDLENENGTFHESKCYPPTYSCSPVSEIEDDVEKHPYQCFLPKIAREFPRFRTVQIHRRQSERLESVLFVGDVFDLLNGIRTTELVPRDWFLSRIFGFAAFSQIPVEVETVLLLVAGLSAGLAVVNMLPIYGLDGYHVVNSIIRSSVGKGWDSRKTSRLVNVISWIALIVALLAVACSLIQRF